MGGFVYHRKRPGVDCAVEMEPGLDALRRKKLSDGRSLTIKEIVDRDDFTIFLYAKIGVETENIFHSGNGDFVLNTGTLIYGNQSGLAALEALYVDFDPETITFDSLQGQFCVILFKNQKLYIWNDLFGIYHVFSNSDQSVISSSFLTVVRQLDSRQLNLQAMYEYVFEGASYNDDTYIHGVDMLDAFNIHTPGLDSAGIRKRHSIQSNDTNDFDQRVAQTVADLKNYFETLKRCFGPQVCSALSGGYDSRLILALLSEAEMQPHLYVYGASQSADVRVACQIGSAEKLEIQHDDRKVKKQSLTEFQELIEAEYYYCDGHGPNGAFTNGAEYQARTVRTNTASFQLNGGGGEIFRNFWKLPRRAISIASFVESRFNYLPRSIFNGKFDRQSYLLNLQHKIQQMLELDSDVMSRDEVEKLYVYMRIKYWMGYNTSIQNLRSYALIPLTEPIFAIPSFSIPFKHKEMGAFEAALIKRLSPRLAAHDSAYGYSFSGKPGLVARLKNSLMLNLPVSLKRRLRKMRYQISGAKMPYYLQQEYIDSIIPADGFVANQYFDMGNIRDPLMLSRLHTINLVLSDPFKPRNRGSDSRPEEGV